MKAATLHLRAAIQQGSVPKGLFSEVQLREIFKGPGGQERIPGLTWHHHQEVGRMILLNREYHADTKHIGGMKTWFSNVSSSQK